MAEQEVVQRREQKLAQVFTRNRLLNFEDMSTMVLKKKTIDEGRIKINLVNIDVDTKKSEQQLWHYANTDGFLLALDDIINERFKLAPPTDETVQASPVYMAKRKPNPADVYLPIYNEFKGGPGSSAKKPEWEWCSRRLTIEFVWSPRYTDTFPEGKAIKLSMSVCQGRKSAQGAFMPLNHTGEMSSSIMMPLATFKVMADKIRRYVTAAEFCRLYSSGGEIPDYEPYARESTNDEDPGGEFIQE